MSNNNLEPNKPYIYLIRNKKNNMIYIGASMGNKKKTYWSSSEYVKKDIEKYGIENFEKIILNTFDTMENAYEAEARLVDEKFVASEYTYNKMPAKFQKSFTSETAKYASDLGSSKGGQACYERGLGIFGMTTEDKFIANSNAGKIGGKRNKGKKKSKEHRKNLSKIRKGNNDWLTQEWRDNMGLGQIKRWEETKSDPEYVNHIKNRKWINKDGESKMVTQIELLDYLNDGWSYGRKV